MYAIYYWQGGHWLPFRGAGHGLRRQMVKKVQRLERMYPTMPLRVARVSVEVAW